MDCQTCPVQKAVLSVARASLFFRGSQRAFSVTGPRRKLPANDSPPCSLTSLVPTLKQLEACWSWTS